MTHLPKILLAACATLLCVGAQAQSRVQCHSLDLVIHNNSSKAIHITGFTHSAFTTINSGPVTIKAHHQITIDATEHDPTGRDVIGYTAKLKKQGSITVFDTDGIYPGGNQFAVNSTTLLESQLDKGPFSTKANCILNPQVNLTITNKPVK